MLETEQLRSASGGPCPNLKNGANIEDDLMAPPPPDIPEPPEDETEEDDRWETTLRLQPGDKEKVVFLADLWNAFDSAKPKKQQRKKKWKASSVLRHLIEDRLASYGAQFRHGWPTTEERRREHLKAAANRNDESKKSK